MTADLVSDVSSEYLALIRMDVRSASNIMRCSLVDALPSTRSQCCCVYIKLQNKHIISLIYVAYTRTWLHRVTVYHLVTSRIIPIPLSIMMKLEYKHIQGGPKIGTIVFVCLRLILPNINWFSNLCHCQNQEKICDKDPTTSQLCCYTTLWNVKCLKSNNRKQDDFCSNTF